MIINFKFGDFEKINDQYFDLFSSVMNVETKEDKDGFVMSVDQVRIVVPDLNMSFRIGTLFKRNPDAIPNDWDVIDVKGVGIFKAEGPIIALYGQDEKDLNKYVAGSEIADPRIFLRNMYYHLRHVKPSSEDVDNLECYIDTSEFSEENSAESCCTNQNKTEFEDNMLLINNQAIDDIGLNAVDVVGEHLAGLFETYNHGTNIQSEKFYWLKNELAAFSIEHLSFCYKNCVFSIFVDIVIDGKSSLSLENRQKIINNAMAYNLIPCTCEVCVRERISDPHSKEKELYLAIANDGWGLKNVKTGLPINPMELANDDYVEMSEWELLNLAIKIARQKVIEKEGFEFESFVDIPGRDPQIWFYDQSGRRAWAIVRFQKVLDESEAEKYKDFARNNPAIMQYDGYFIPTSAITADPILYDSQGKIIPLSKRFDGSTPLYRGHEVRAFCKGLIKIHNAE